MQRKQMTRYIDAREIREFPERWSKHPEPYEGRRMYGFELVWLPPGRFGPDRRLVNFPYEEMRQELFRGHEIEVTKGFWISRYQVMQAQWEEVMLWNPSRYVGDSRRPVECVSWDDGQDFLARINELSGGKFRLPTRIEWAYACRSGDDLEYYGGGPGDSLWAHAWFIDNSGGTTHPVGTKDPTEWGLYDMHGNVWEWVQDSDPRDVLSKHCCGGSFGDSIYGLGSSYRQTELRSTRRDNIGFRVCGDM